MGVHSTSEYILCHYLNLCNTSLNLIQSEHLKLYSWTWLSLELSIQDKDHSWNINLSYSDLTQLANEPNKRMLGFNNKLIAQLISLMHPDSNILLKNIHILKKNILFWPGT